jgi:hypothetical protein
MTTPLLSNAKAEDPSGPMAPPNFLKMGVINCRATIILSQNNSMTKLQPPTPRASTTNTVVDDELEACEKDFVAMYGKAASVPHYLLNCMVDKC